jgi:hypothetical protein
MFLFPLPSRSLAMSRRQVNSTFFPAKLRQQMTEDLQLIGPVTRI